MGFSSITEILYVEFSKLLDFVSNMGLLES